jgi:choline dehydrogenase-like flavoprotein
VGAADHGKHQEKATVHPNRRPATLYVADTTLLPQPLSNPPILTIVALAKRVSRMCAQ